MSVFAHTVNAGSSRPRSSGRAAHRHRARAGRAPAATRSTASRRRRSPAHPVPEWAEREAAAAASAPGQPAAILRASALSGAGLRPTLQRDSPLALPEVAATTRQPASARVAVTRPIRSPHADAFARRTARTAATAWGFVNNVQPAGQSRSARSRTRQRPIRAVAASDPRTTARSSHSASGKSISEQARALRRPGARLHQSPKAAQAFR